MVAERREKGVKWGRQMETEDVKGVTELRNYWLEGSESVLGEGGVEGMARPCAQHLAH